MSATGNGNNKATITCPHCQQRFSAPLPKMGVVNELRASIAIATHEKPIRCICGKYAVWIMQTAQASWGIMPINDEQVALLEDSKIITPPPGLSLLP